MDEQSEVNGDFEGRMAEARWRIAFPQPDLCYAEVVRAEHGKSEASLLRMGSLHMGSDWSPCT